MTVPSFGQGLQSDPAIRAVVAAVVINVLLRVGEWAYGHPWDPMVVDVIDLYTVLVILRLIDSTGR